MRAPIQVDFFVPEGARILKFIDEPYLHGQQSEVFPGGLRKFFDYIGHAQSSKALTPNIVTYRRSKSGTIELDHHYRKTLYNCDNSVSFTTPTMRRELELFFGDQIHKPNIFYCQGVASIDNNANFSDTRNAIISVSKFVESHAFQHFSDTVLSSVIPPGINFDLLSIHNSRGKREIDVFIDAVKNPELGRKISREIAKFTENITIISDRVPQYKYLNLISNSRVSIFCPSEIEGFYMPPLEAVYLGSYSFCSRAGGNSEYLDDQIVFEFSENFILGLIEQVIQKLAVHTDNLNRTTPLLDQYSISAEKESFEKFVEQVSLNSRLDQNS